MDSTLTPMNDPLILFRGYHYYINESNQVIIYTPKNKHLEFELDHSMMPFLPFMTMNNQKTP